MIFNVNLTKIFLILWIVAGVIVMVAAAGRNEGIPIFSYFCCWLVLILELIDRLIIDDFNIIEDDSDDDDDGAM